MAGEEKDENFNLTFSVVQVVTNPSDHYLEADWQTILLSPLWVFDIVANADGGIDAKEQAAFAQTLQSPPQGIMTAFVFSHVRRHLESLARVRAADQRSPLYGLADVHTLLRGYPSQEDAELFRRGLVVLARNIADASGSMFNRSRVSEQEAAIVDHIRAALHVTDRS